MTIKENLCEQESLHKIDLGCGNNKSPGAIGVDNVALDAVDLVHDLLSFPYPFPSECAEEVVLSHVLEHFSIEEINVILDEVYRILAPGGIATISVPHALTVAFNTDPTHKTRFTFETLHYFTSEHRFSYYHQLTPRWRITRLWASINILNNHFTPDGPLQRLIAGYFSRSLSRIVRRSRTMTLPDQIVKHAPFWLVSIHCKLQKVE
jgi:SAM-dependent methyltransferase